VSSHTRLPRRTPLLAWAILVIAGTLAGQNHAAASAQITVQRLAGVDRYETAASISEATYKGTPFSLVLARGDLYPDALAGTYLAGFLHASLLLTPQDRLAPGARQEIERLEPSEIDIMGDVTAVSQQVENELRAMGIDTYRVAGRDRYETAARAAAIRDDGGAQTVVVASGETFADALAAGPLVSSHAYPLLLTPRDRLHPATRDALQQNVIIVGGPAAVSAEVEQEIASQCWDGPNGRECVQVRRIAGRTRAETAIRIAEFANWSPSHIHLARGDAFPDGIAGGPHAGLEQAPILLTQSPTELGEVTRQWLEDHAGEVDSIHVFGSQAAVSDDVVEDARQAATR
jgi:putative cell wall-binding protein